MIKILIAFVLGVILSIPAKKLAMKGYEFIKAKIFKREI